MARWPGCCCAATAAWCAGRSVGSPGGSPLTVPLTYRGTAVADLVVTGPPGERLDARTQTDLAALSGVLAAATRLTKTSADPAAAQARTTAARAGVAAGR
jgi:hypothetical protein